MKILKENLHINLDGLTRSWSEKSHFNKSTNQNSQKLVFIEYFDESTCTEHVDIEYVNLLKFSSNFVHVKPYLLPYERNILML